MEELWSSKPRVGSSNLSRGTKYTSVAQLEERRPTKAIVGGSSPSGSANYIGRNYGVVGHYDMMPSSVGFDPHRPTNKAAQGETGNLCSACSDDWTATKVGS